MTAKLKIILFLSTCASIFLPGVDKLSAQEPIAHPGLKTVVIDPGHGGKDSGSPAKGKSIHEKHIVLSVAKLFGVSIIVSLITVPF